MKNIIFNTFKEIIRNKFLSLIVIFALAFIIFSVSLWKLTIWDDNKIIVDFWLAMIEIFWLISVLFVWSQLLFKEIEWKTIFLILSKPIKRYEFILWKYFWFSLSILLVFLIQFILFLTVLFFKDIEITKLIIMSWIFIFVKLEILLAIVFFFSTFMSTILTIVVSIMVYFLAHSLTVVIDMVVRTQNTVLIYLTKWLEVVFPPFKALNTKDVIWSFDNFSNIYFILNFTYAISYLILILFFTVIIFNRKKFES